MNKPCPVCKVVDVQNQRAWGHCLHCGRHIGAVTWGAWAKVVKTPCPGCGRAW